ncbi:MAG: aminopeptidase [Woeseiaceae bacterium]
MISLIVDCRSGLSKLTLIVVLSQLSGCYYMQAASGQMEIVRKREPIEEVVAAPESSPELIARLELINDARQFSIDVLGLPDNDSYRSYADLERDFVVWNVIAAPEFSLRPKTWCYPIVGCVSYRGYFSEDDARKLADDLDADGYDIAFGGVAAYSTLGKFDDPILSTMMRWGDNDLVAVMFHELAHQVLYVKDDTGFNESFATAVEEFGMERWLASRGQLDELSVWRERRELRAEFASLIADARAELKEIYAQDSDEQEKRRQKNLRMETLATAAKTLFADAESEAPGWLDTELNNARLVATTLYHGRLPEFRALLADCGRDLPCFYKAARTLADST